MMIMIFMTKPEFETKKKHINNKKIDNQVLLIDKMITVSFFDKIEKTIF